jgi:hypothetical protein
VARRAASSSTAKPNLTGHRNRQVIRRRDDSASHTGRPRASYSWATAARDFTPPRIPANRFPAGSFFGGFRTPALYRSIARAGPASETLHEAPRCVAREGRSGIGASSSLPRVPAKVSSPSACRPPSSCNANPLVSRESERQKSARKIIASADNSLLRDTSRHFPGLSGAAQGIVARPNSSGSNCSR